MGYEAMIRAIEEKDVKKLKRVLKKSIIHPKMIYLSRKLGIPGPGSPSPRSVSQEKAIRGI